MSGSGMRAYGATLACVVAAASVGACNFIVGAGNYSVGDAGAGPNDGGPSSDSGPAVCGSGLPTSSATFQKLVSTCMLASSCDPRGFNVSASQCIELDYLHSLGSQACLTTIATCADYANCTGYARPTSAQCPTASTAPSCSGTTAIDCAAGGTVECNKLGGSCAVYDSDAGLAAGCLVVSSCSQPDGTTACQGDILYTCIGGQGFGNDCSLANAKCIADPTQGTNCYFNGASCSTPGQTCSNNTYDLCTADNGLIPLNCSTAGLTCTENVDDAGSADCLAPGCTEMDRANCLESCSGSLANVCVGGAPLRFDCSKLPGFSTCGTYSDNSETRARCVP